MRTILYCTVTRGDEWQMRMQMVQMSVAMSSVEQADDSSRKADTYNIYIAANNLCRMIS